MPPKEYLEGKKVLVAGLGLFGGGEATAKWLLKQGAEVTVTDLKTKTELAKTLKKFTKKQKESITFVLGRHRKSDFKRADIVVVNPGMPRESKYLKVAKEAGVPLENVASLLFRFLGNPAIGITGTRGKSTTTSYLTQFLKKADPRTTLLGSSESPLLKDFDGLSKKKDVPVVVELSSWQLELLPRSKKAPHVAVVTNLYCDHQNRYKSMKAYAKAKANIFKYQTAEDHLILSDDDEWTEYFLSQKPKAHVSYISTKPLAKKKDGMYLSKADTLWLRIDGVEKKLFSLQEFKKQYGRHNIENLLAAMLSSRLMFPESPVIKNDILKLAPVHFRQEIIYQESKKQVVNDTAATSPDATIAALDRFSGQKSDVVLLAGGTDKRLDYTALAHVMKNKVYEDHLFLLEGSGTKKLVNELQKIAFFKKEPQIFSSFKEAVDEAYEAFQDTESVTLLFSPAGSSFEMFTNEVDRGEQFNTRIKQLTKRKR